MHQHAGPPAPLPVVYVGPPQPQSMDGCLTAAQHRSMLCHEVAVNGRKDELGCVGARGAARLQQAQSGGTIAGQQRLEQGIRADIRLCKGQLCKGCRKEQAREAIRCSARDGSVAAATAPKAALSAGQTTTALTLNQSESRQAVM